MRKPILHLLIIVSIVLTSCENEVDPKLLPVVSTTEVSSVSYYSAQSGGVITADGGYDIIARGVCWSTSSNPDIKGSKTVDAGGTGTFVSLIDSLMPGTTYYLRAYATNSKGISYGLEETFTTMILILPEVVTNSITDITSTTAKVGSAIISDGGAPILSRGVCFSVLPSPTISDGVTNDGNGMGSYQSTITGLKTGVFYYVRAYATNSVGTSYGEELKLYTVKDGEIYNPVTDRIWMDRNLGASRVALSSTDSLAYGDLYQWGRGSDGHEKRFSKITYVLSNTDKPNDSTFIVAISTTGDWRSPQNNNLWQGLEGGNNPCPTGYRIPTIAEWDAERASWSSDNLEGAFNSPLKLPAAGGRNQFDGRVFNIGSYGYYWSATVYESYSQYLYFTISEADTSYAYRAYGSSVRCIKD